MNKLIIFASGGGTNAAAIIDYFRNSDNVTISLIVTNRPDAGVIEIASKEKIPFLIVSRQRLGETPVLDELQAHNPAHIILAGFLLKIPPSIIQAFRGRIVNIHPALLPAYGGKGMWGHHVHEAVLASGDAHSGITIHHVDEEYDHGATLLQAHCPVLPRDTAGSLANRVLQLEHFYYPRAIDFLLKTR